jgi:hypothetical protein
VGFSLKVFEQEFLSTEESSKGKILSRLFSGIKIHRKETDKKRKASKDTSQVKSEAFST